MLKEYQIENFKAFAEPVNIPIKPITLIFGANSSGKSSIFQSLLMLKQTLQEGSDQNISLLPKGNLVDLGSFRGFIHNHDVSNSFSFKMTFPFNRINEAYDSNLYDYIIETYEKHPNVDVLEKSIGSETIGLSVTFSLDINNIIIRAINLYIGNDPKPIITYEIGGKTDLGYQYQFKGNFDHKYWRTYWKCFDEGKSEYIEKEIHEHVSMSGIMTNAAALSKKFPNLSDKKKEMVKALFEKINIDIEKMRLKQGKYSKRADEITKLEKELNKMTDFEKAVEFYGFKLEDYQLKLEGFLPTDEMEYLLWNYDFAYLSSRNPSLFALTAANLIKKLLNDVEYIAPLREYPERFYIYGGNPLESVGSSGKMVFDVLFNNPELLDKVNDEFKRFGTDYELRLSPYMKDKSETSEVFVPELFNKSTGVAASFRDVGFGFSQVLPVIVQSMLSKEKTLLIEQPELHLHPALQAELGDVFIESALGKNKNTFLIETHSEHLILRLLRRIRETTESELEEGDNPLRPEDVAVIYAKPTEKGTELIELRITEDGDFADKWPDGFFAERAKELF